MATASLDLATASLDLARRFAAGATMWCLAPEWPAHAQHLAVEFVHPVIVGKRALPAFLVEGPDHVQAVRVLSSPGDILVAVARADYPDVGAVMRRAPAWGLTTVWIGCGDRPSPGAADHVLWSSGTFEEAAYGGGFVLTYHVLWELTHVCFEHPGLLETRDGASVAECTDDICVTCSDEGRLAEVVEAVGDFEARVRTPAGVETIDTTLIDRPHAGDLVLVHAGSAVSLVDAAAAIPPRSEPAAARPPGSDLPAPAQQAH